jgi:nicotinamidase-related amidase
LARAGGVVQPGSHAGRAAVLALDLLSDFSFPDGARVRRALELQAAPIRRLLEAARRQRVPVFYVNDNLGAWRSDSAALIERCIQPGLPGADLVRSLLPDARDEIVLKPRHSAFFGTPLMALLGQRRIDTLVLSGVSAESCVWMTASDAHTRGFELVIPRDTMAGASPKAMRAMLTGVREVLSARVPARGAGLRFSRGRIV